MDIVLMFNDSCSYCSCVGMKTEKTEHFTTENYATPDILKSSKVPKIRLSHEVIDMLCEIFETDDEKFKKALLRQKHFGNCSETHLRNTALYLRELNITEDHINFAPGILLLKKAKTPLIEESYLFKNIRDGLGFAFLHPELISAFNKQFEREDELFDPYRNRIYYIGGKLNIPIDFLTLKIVTENKILSLEKKTLDMYIDLLVEAKCRPMAILNYFKIFYFNYNILKKRLNEVGQLKGSPVPTLWWCFTTEESL
ncbi:hypothetical protein Avbf_10154 [Armadillidium vulgare]|nr:hypothetical protein Avbf_10154 [Armadillidium vulgare]